MPRKPLCEGYTDFGEKFCREFAEVKCPKCNGHFCKDHVAPYKHDCFKGATK